MTVPEDLQQKQAGYTIGQYIDISLYKYMTVDGVTDNGVQLHSTADKIKIAVQTFTFETDKFSDYAIAYKDVKKADATGTNNAVKTTKSVKTGDTTNVFGYLITLIGAFAVILGLFASRRKRTNK